MKTESQILYLIEWKPSTISNVTGYFAANNPADAIEIWQDTHPYCQFISIKLIGDVSYSTEAR